MSSTQTTILDIIKLGYNTFSDIEKRSPIRHRSLHEELLNLEALGLIEANMVRTMWFIK